jgi:Na+/H+ antiporter NhaD/arsenite permease-like protein
MSLLDAMNLSILVLFGVLALIAARMVGRIRVAIWQAMVAGALAVLMTGQITPAAALAAIDLEVMLFLFGMFVLGEALVESGYLYAVAYRWLSRVRTTDTLVLAVVVASGLASALLMNDTLAIIATPLVLRLALEHRIATRLLLLALAFGITTGSAMSPIGNPQNLLIAVHGPVEAPLVNFLQVLALPTLINLLLCYLVLRVLFRHEFHRVPLVHSPVVETDPELARLARTGLWLVVAGIAMRVMLPAAGYTLHLPFSLVALVGATPVLLLSSRRLSVLRDIDWSTLAFFAAMFVLMASVWNSGVLLQWLAVPGWNLDSLPVVLGVGVLLSQLISNVPLVALYLPVLQSLQATSGTLLALAAGSTIAGNLLVLGAASNVIIMQRAERRGSILQFRDFARAGIPLTLLQTGVYWLFL